MISDWLIADVDFAGRLHGRAALGYSRDYDKTRKESGRFCNRRSMWRDDFSQLLCDTSL